MKETVETNAFDATRFIGLFENFDANELEIYTILNEMTEYDLDRFKHECEKDIFKYNELYWSTDELWHTIHETEG